jgi:hypothetical protein
MGSRVVVGLGAIVEYRVPGEEGGEEEKEPPVGGRRVGDRDICCLLGCSVCGGGGGEVSVASLASCGACVEAVGRLMLSFLLLCRIER